MLGTNDYLRYDKLILATGADAFIPPSEEYQQDGIFCLRDAEQGLQLRNWIQRHNARTVAILGGGVLGVEATQAFHQLNLDVHLIHTGPYLMDNLLDETAGLLLGMHLEHQGIHIHTGCGIDQIGKRQEQLPLILTDGRCLDADLLLLCIGIRSRTQLARDAGLEVDRGIVVDDQQRTSHPDIYCVGDAAQAPSGRGGLWAVGLEQGKRAAESICLGETSTPASNTPVVQLKVPDIDLKSFGSFTYDPGSLHFKKESMAGQHWFHVQLQNGRMIAGVFVNETRLANRILSHLDSDRTWDEASLLTVLNEENSVAPV